MSTIHEMDQEARQAGFLNIEHGMYMRQLSEATAIFIEKEKQQYICYRLKWGRKKSSFEGQIIDEKFYCRGSWKKTFGKAKRIVEYWEENILRK